MDRKICLWWKRNGIKHMYESSTCIYIIYRIWCSQYVVFLYVSGIHSYSTYMNLITNLNFKEVDWLLCRLFRNTILIMYVSCNCASRLRQPIENSLVLCHLKTFIYRAFQVWAWPLLDKRSTSKEYVLGLTDSI